METFISKTDMFTMLMALMRSEGCASETIAVAAEAIAANARFNYRVAAIKRDHNVDDEQFLMILDLADELNKKCGNSIQEYNQNRDWTRLNVVLIEIANQLNGSAI
jgi:hypothetical protein